ncbi:MAG: hypothetical protein J5737_06715 [Bacteroidales bacterium]|nr:hypothetical protein [Bacteroidales bacterium]
MKSYIKYLVSALALSLCLLSCSKDPDVPIYSELDFHQCLRPISFKCTVNYVDVTVNLHTFPDAEAYEIEVYTSDLLSLAEGEEPYADDLIHKALVKSEDIPYTFTGPDETNCYIRCRAVNETKKRLPSEWVMGHVKTDVDPLTTCATPGDFKVKTNYNWITCTLTTMPNVKEYVIEVGTEQLPAGGEANPDILISSVALQPTDFPFTIKGIPAGTYYYRIQGRNAEEGLKPSKWVRGSFTTKDYYWMDTEGTYDYGLAVGGYKETKYDKATITAELNALFGKKGVTEGNTYTWDYITYGPLCSYSDDKFAVNRCKNWDKTSYAKDFPLESYLMLEVTRPGTMSFIPRATANTEDKMPEIVVGVLATRDGSTTFTYVYQEKLKVSPTINVKNEENRLTIEIPDDALYGITEPAKLYLFTNLQSLIIYPIKWTRTQ